MHQQAGTFFLRISKAKDTRDGGDGKTRDAYLPRSVEHTLLRLQSQKGIEENNPFLSYTTTRIRQLVNEVAEDVADEIENGADYPGRADDWRKLSSHDLRRYFAQTALLREEMSPSVVMTVGGWNSMQALEPYLTTATPEEVADEFEAVGWN
jgi:integrase